MTASPLIDQRFVAAFLLGPLLGAFLYAAIVGVFAGSGSEGFWFYLATSLAYGYAASLLMLAVVLPASCAVAPTSRAQTFI